MAARRRSSSRRRRPDDISPWPFAGMAGMASVLFLYGASGLLAPWWVAVLLLLVWLVLFVQACRWFVPFPVRVFWLPVGGIAFWFAFLLGGEALWGWG